MVTLDHLEARFQRVAALHGCICQTNCEVVDGVALDQVPKVYQSDNSRVLRSRKNVEVVCITVDHRHAEGLEEVSSCHIALKLSEVAGNEFLPGHSHCSRSILQVDKVVSHNGNCVLEIPLIKSRGNCKERELAALVEWPKERRRRRGRVPDSGLNDSNALSILPS